MLHQFRRPWRHHSTSAIPTSAAASIPTISPEQEYQHSEDDDEDSHRYRSLLTNVTTTATTTPEKSLAKKIAAILFGQPIPWPTEVEATLTQLYPSITRTVVFHSLDIIKPPSAALHFFNFLRRRLHFPLDDRIHFKLLQVLCRCRDLSPAREFLFSLHTDPADDTLLVLHDRFFNELIRAHARRRQMRQSIDLFRIMKDEFGVPPSVFSYNSLLAALFGRGRTVSAKKVFDEMIERPTKGSHDCGVTPDVCTFNTMIRGFCLNGFLEEGFRWFSEMTKWRCGPDVCTYNTLLDGLCRAGKVDVARNFFNGMKNKSDDVRPNVVSYTTLIRGYCQKRRVSEALEVFREMTTDNVEPNKITFNTIIHGLCEAGKFEQTKEIMDFGLNSGFKPDICTLNTVITAYCDKSNIADAMKTFHTMVELKLKADLATYSVLIRTLCQTRDFEKAEVLLDDMMNKRAFKCKKGSTILMAAYNPIFNYLCENGKSNKAGDVFKLVLTKSTLDSTSFKILILGHCKESNFHQGYTILLEMLSRELVPDEETYQALVDGFSKDENMEFAWKTYKKMLNNGYRPKTATFHTMLQWLAEKPGCAHEASELLVLMLERRIMLDIELSTLTTIALYRNSLHGRGFEIVEMLYERGYSLKMEELVRSLFADRKFLEARDLLLFSIEKHQNLTGGVYVVGIRGLCGYRRAMDAFRLFYELNEKRGGGGGGGGCVVEDCLEELEICLEREGKLREAEFVCKRRTATSH